MGIGMPISQANAPFIGKLLQHIRCKENAAPAISFPIDPAGMLFLIFRKWLGDSDRIEKRRSGKPDRRILVTGNTKRSDQILPISIKIRITTNTRPRPPEGK